MQEVIPSGLVCLDDLEVKSDTKSRFIARIKVPASTLFSYKYIVRKGSGEVVWENDGDHQVISAPEGSVVVRSDTWQD